MVWYPFVLTLLRLSAAGSIVIAAVLLARIPLKKAPRWISYALWAVVLVRLLAPVSLETPHGVVPHQTRDLQDTAYYYPYYRQTSPAAAADAAQRAVGDTLNGGIGTVYIRLTAENELDSGVLPATAAYHRQVWPLALTAVWPIGAGAMALYAAVSYVRLRRKLVGAVKLEGSVYLADRIPSPFVLGLFRPKIYLPSTLSPTETEYILLHERTHIRRLDHVTRLLAYGALTLHWFNPLVWLAFALSRKDMELSCDEAVLRRTAGDIRADYSQSLLNLAAGRRLLPGTPLAFGEGGVKGRVKNVLRWKNASAGLVAVGLIPAVLLGGCLMTDQSQTTDEKLLDYFNEEFFADTFDAMSDPERSLRNHFTACYYRTPREIDYKALFYDGVPGGQVFRTEADRENLSAADAASPAVQTYFDQYGPICPIYQGTLDQMDAAILEYTGVSMDGVHRRGMEQFKYIDGSLFWANGDSNCGPLTFDTLEREGDLLHLTYRQTPEGYDVLTLREIPGGYQFVSNLHYYYDDTLQFLQNYLTTEYSELELFPVTFTRDPRWEADYDLIGFTARKDTLPQVGYAVAHRTLSGTQIPEANSYGYDPFSYAPATDMVYGNVSCGAELERNTFFLCFSNDPALARVRVTADGVDYWEQDVTAPLMLAVPVTDILPDVHVYFYDGGGTLITERYMKWSDTAHRQQLAYFAENAQKLLSD